MLINCPECGSQVSDKAKCCPHCGYSLEDARNERAAKEAAIIAQANRAAYDATFRPNEIYLASPMPFKALFRAFTTKGRASRAEFWSFFVVFLVSEFMMLLVAGKTKSDESVGLWAVIFILMNIWEVSALLTAVTRRQHDAGHDNAGCMLEILAFVCLLIPIIGWIVFVALMIVGCRLFDPSEPGSNEHGPNPETFYNRNESQPIPCPRPDEFVRNRKTDASEEKDQRVIVLVCPHCGKECETEEEIQVGQHVLCPFCGEKFSFGGMED